MFSNATCEGRKGSAIARPPRLQFDSGEVYHGKQSERLANTTAGRSEGGREGLVSDFCSGRGESLSLDLPFIFFPFLFWRVFVFFGFSLSSDFAPAGRPNSPSPGGDSPFQSADPSAECNGNIRPAAAPGSPSRGQLTGNGDRKYMARGVE